MSQDNVNIACFLWDNWYDKGPEYVDKLYYGIATNIHQGFNFYCFTDNINQGFKYKSYINFIKINLTGKLNILRHKNLRKLLIHNPDNNIHGRIVVFDLDVIITGSLDEIINYQGNFCICRSPLDEKTIGGNLISFKSEIWKEKLWDSIFNTQIVKKINGSERYFYRQALKGEQFDHWEKLFPDQIISYKHHMRNKKITEIPNNTRLIWFHGNPKTHVAVAQNSNLAKYWRDE